MLIEFQQVTVRRGPLEVLQNLNIKLSESRVGIIGPNGAGKSTFARLINGLIRPSSGSVVVNGLLVSDHLHRVREQAGFLFQNPDNQIVFPIVQEDMAFGLKPTIPDKETRAARIDQTLSQLDISGLSTRAVHTLSGGQKQLVALATVLCMRPDFLVLDEPTTQLDLSHRNRLLAILDGLAQPLLVITHDLEMLKAYDRVLVIDKGGIQADGPPADVLPWYRAQHA
jgi:biotin transport system ATP-binding protein